MLMMAGLPASNLSGAFAHITQSREINLVVPPPELKGISFGNALFLKAAGKPDYFIQFLIGYKVFFSEIESLTFLLPIVIGNIFFKKIGLCWPGLKRGVNLCRVETSP